jgi:hypothetical protein
MLVIVDKGLCAARQCPQQNHRGGSKVDDFARKINKVTGSDPSVAQWFLFRFSSTHFRTVRATIEVVGMQICQCTLLYREMQVSGEEDWFAQQ